MEKLHVDIESLRSMHRFGDILEAAIASIDSETAEFQAIRSAADCIGRHWYGLRCGVTCKKTQVFYYLHIGLIYYPDTRVGLMVELDEQNNHASYDMVKAKIAERPAFEINRDEPEYFKLFMPDDTFTQMSRKLRGEQVRILASYVQAAGEAIAEAGYQQGFTITYKNMSDSLNLVQAFDRVLNENDSDISRITVNYADKDNFGQYAQGFRYYLEDADQTMKMYAYFGAIYSYKKEPAGIFAEIDWFSNQPVFDQVYPNMKDHEKYSFSRKEPKFIKLFMKEEETNKLNEAPYEEQIQILKDFLKTCNDQMILAAKEGGA